MSLWSPDLEDQPHLAREQTHLNYKDIQLGKLSLLQAVQVFRQTL